MNKFIESLKIKDKPKERTKSILVALVGSKETAERKERRRREIEAKRILNGESILVASIPKKHEGAER